MVCLSLYIAVWKVVDLYNLYGCNLEKYNKYSLLGHHET